MTRFVSYDELRSDLEEMPMDVATLKALLQFENSFICRKALRAIENLEAEVERLHEAAIYGDASYD